MCLNYEIKNCTFFVTASLFYFNWPHTRRTTRDPRIIMKIVIRHNFLLCHRCYRNVFIYSVYKYDLIWLIDTQLHMNEKSCESVNFFYQFNSIYTAQNITNYTICLEGFTICIHTTSLPQMMIHSMLYTSARCQIHSEFWIMWRHETVAGIVRLSLNTNTTCQCTVSLLPISYSHLVPNLEVETHPRGPKIKWGVVWVQQGCKSDKKDNTVYDWYICMTCSSFLWEKILDIYTSSLIDW